MNCKKLLHKTLVKLGSQKIKRLIRQKSAHYYLQKNSRRIKGDGTFRVGFIVYEPAMWDKQEPVFAEMEKCDHIDPYIIVVPDVSFSPDEAKKKQAFFLNRYRNVLFYDESVITRFKNGFFHYSFYQTPYNFKYPVAIQPHNIVKYSKICFIPYAYVGAGDFLEVSSKVDFFENVYFGFMDNETMLEVLTNKFNKECKKGLQHFEFAGYPPFESYINTEKSESIDNVLWIPRWSYAEVGGGSHFLEHKDLYNQLASVNKNVCWTMRPHPLMFTTLAKQGLFSEENAEKYFHDLADAGVSLDTHSLLNETLLETDLLIADYSSIIVMYFLTGRPIIYCDGGIKLNGIYEKMYEAMYIAQEWDDVVRYFNQLKQGIDPLKEKRETIAATEIKKHINSTKRIVDRIRNDYCNH